MSTTELLRQMIAVNSAFPGDDPSPERPGEQDLGEFLEGILRAQGFRVERQAVREGRFNVLAEKGEGDHVLLLTGHLDTVPAVAGWNTAWNPQVDGDCLFGLGSCDMKGGLAAILGATDGFEPQGFRLKVAFVVDEENISVGAATLTASEWLDDVAAILVPEGPQPKGGIDLTLGRRGRVTIDIHVKGLPAHAAFPDQGESALLRAAAVALALQRLEPACHPQLIAGGLTIRQFVSKTAGLSIPDTAKLTIDRHLVPPETADTAVQEIKDLINGLYEARILKRDEERMPITVEVPLRPTPYLEAYVTPSDHPFVTLVADIVKKHGGRANHEYGMSVADENLYGALGKPVVVLGPIGGNAHAEKEWVSLASVDRLANIYRDVLETWPIARDRFFGRDGHRSPDTSLSGNEVTYGSEPT